MRLPLLLAALLVGQIAHAQQVHFVVERAKSPGGPFHMYVSGGANAGEPALLSQGTQFTAVGSAAEPLFIGDRMQITPVSTDAKGDWTMDIDATFSHLDEAPTANKHGFAYSQSRVLQRVVVTPGGPPVQLHAGPIAGTVRVSLKPVVTKD